MTALARQIVVRVSEEQYAAIAADAEANGRTVAQTVRFHLRGVGSDHALTAPTKRPAEPECNGSSGDPA